MVCLERRITQGYWDEVTESRGFKTRFNQPVLPLKRDELVKTKTVSSPEYERVGLYIELATGSPPLWEIKGRAIGKIFYTDDIYLALTHLMKGTKFVPRRSRKYAR